MPLRRAHEHGAPYADAGTPPPTRVAVGIHLDASIDELQEMAAIGDAEMALIAYRLRDAYAAFGTTPGEELARRLKRTQVFILVATALSLFPGIEAQIAHLDGDTGWFIYVGMAMSVLPIAAAWISTLSYGAPPRRSRTDRPGRQLGKIRRDLPNCVDWAMLGILDQVVPELYGFHNSYHREYRRRAALMVQHANAAIRSAGTIHGLLPMPRRDAAEYATARRLARVMLDHRRAVACMLGRSDLERIASSLAAGLLAWAQGDSAALFEHAPQSPSGASWTRVFDFAQRLAWAAAVVSAAVVLPHFVPAARPYAGYLWLAAVGALLAGPSVVATSIGRIQDSLLPGKPSR